MADAYAATKNIRLSHGVAHPKVDPAHAAKIAQAYDAMKHDPNHPEVKKAYGALIKETLDQLNTLHDHGYKFSKIAPDQSNPYATSRDLHDDVRGNKHLWYYPTSLGAGNEGDVENNTNPLVTTQVKTKSGVVMPANDAFRIVHDAFGHAKEGTSFGPNGEEAAWRDHMQMFSPDAQKALTSETRGQNSYVNFGPNAGHNRKNPAQTIYATQKTGIMPDWTRSPAKKAI